VLVVGCSQQPGLQTASQTATLALLGFSTLPPTPAPTLFVIRTPTLTSPQMMIMTLAPTPLPLRPDTPHCYETQAGGLACLGLVYNGLSVPIEAVIVRVYLVTAQGEPLAYRDVSPAHRLIRPGESAPYRALFEQNLPGAAGAVATLHHATKASDYDVVAVTIRDARYVALSNYHRVSGQVVNQHSPALNQIQVTVTLFDNKGRVTGYRQVNVYMGTPLYEGDAAPFTAEVVPHGSGTTRFEVSAEGYAALLPTRAARPH
jgi:hypothetical protein